MSIILSVAQQYELINESDASLVGEKPAFQAICPFGYDDLQSLVHSQKKMRCTYAWLADARK